MSDKQKPGVWVLTSHYNAYDQHGAYLCCIWPAKPTTEQLAEHFKYTTGHLSNVMAALHFLLHLGKGGGRQGTEDKWYELDYVEFGVDKECEE